MLKEKTRNAAQYSDAESIFNVIFANKETVVKVVSWISAFSSL